MDQSDKVKDEVSDIARLLGKRGGDATKAKYGTDHYKKLMTKAANARWDKYRKEKAEKEKNDKTKEKLSD